LDKTRSRRGPFAGDFSRGAGVGEFGFGLARGLLAARDRRRRDMAILPELIGRGPARLAQPLTRVLELIARPANAGGGGA